MNIEIKKEESENLKNVQNQNPHLIEPKSHEKNSNGNSDQNLYYADLDLANNSTPQKNSEKKAKFNSAKKQNIKVEDFFESNVKADAQTYKGKYKKKYKKKFKKKFKKK